MLLSFLPLTKTVSKGKDFCDAGGMRRSGTAHPWVATSWKEASLPLPKGGAGPGFCPESSRGSMAALRCICCAGPAPLGTEGSLLGRSPCCFRPCRVFGHYILAFTSLLLFIDFDNYSGL